MELQAFELSPTPPDHVLVKAAVKPVCATDVKIIGGHAIKTSSTSEGIRAAIEMVRRTGSIVDIGLSGGLGTPVSFDMLVWKSVSRISGPGKPEMWPMP